MKLGQGRDNAKDFLDANPEIMAEIEDKIKSSEVEVVMASKKNKKAAKLEEKSAAAAKPVKKGRACNARSYRFGGGRFRGVCSGGYKRAWRLINA